MPRTKYRLSVPLSLDIYAQIQAEAEAIGVSPATHVAHLIGYHLATTKSILNGLNETLRKGAVNNEKQISNDE